MSHLAWAISMWGLTGTQSSSGHSVDIVGLAAGLKSCWGLRAALPEAAAQWFAGLNSIKRSLREDSRKNRELSIVFIVK